MSTYSHRTPHRLRQLRLVDIPLVEADTIRPLCFRNPADGEGVEKRRR